MRKKKIYIVEDRAEYIRWYEAFFKKIENIELFVEFTGDEGFEMIKSGDPDLIILDYNIPKLNGVEICKRLRKIDKFKKVPIIIVSSSPLDGNKNEIFAAAGFDLFLEKPLRMIKFKEVLTKFID